MIYKELVKTDEAPEKGFVLAYTRQNVIFQEYMEKNVIENMLEGKELLEIHLFNKYKEYRAVVTTGKRKFGKTDMAIEHIADFGAVDTDKYSVYEDNVLLENDFKLKNYDSIKILNKVVFDDNGMANVDDYRLVIE